MSCGKSCSIEVPIAFHTQTNTSLKNCLKLTFLVLKKDAGSCFLPTEIVFCHLHPEVLHYRPLDRPYAGISSRGENTPASELTLTHDRGYVVEIQPGPNVLGVCFFFTVETNVDSVKRRMGDYGWIVDKPPPKRNACLPARADSHLPNVISGG